MIRREADKLSSETVMASVDDDSFNSLGTSKALQKLPALVGVSFENPQDLLLQLERVKAPEVIVSDIRLCTNGWDDLIRKGTQTLSEHSGDHYDCDTLTLICG